MPGLIEGKDYMFRVRAVNSEGESEPLETDTSTKAKNPYGEVMRDHERYFSINLNTLLKLTDMPTTFLYPLTHLVQLFTSFHHHHRSPEPARQAGGEGL